MVVGESSPDSSCGVTFDGGNWVRVRQRVSERLLKDEGKLSARKTGTRNVARQRKEKQDEILSSQRSLES